MHLTNQAPKNAESTASGHCRIQAIQEFQAKFWVAGIGKKLGICHRSTTPNRYKNQGDCFWIAVDAAADVRKVSGHELCAPDIAASNRFLNID